MAVNAACGERPKNSRALDVGLVAPRFTGTRRPRRCGSVACDVARVLVVAQRQEAWARKSFDLDTTPSGVDFARRITHLL
jgi:hypothetical protein